MSEQTATATEQCTGTEHDKQHQATPHGQICWTELASKDIETAKKFYKELLGWALAESKAASMNYTEIVNGEEHIGGMYQLTEECGGADAKSHWMSYVAVDDVDDSARRVWELGGKVVVPPMDIPNVGRFCVINDPTGAAISLITLRRA
jgi:predicted enzyme related to lactoylglutathione lyase